MLEALDQGPNCWRLNTTLVGSRLSREQRWTTCSRGTTYEDSLQLLQSLKNVLAMLGQYNNYAVALSV